MDSVDFLGGIKLLITNAKYLKVDLKGDALRWTAHAHWTSNFSELKDDSN